MDASDEPQSVKALFETAEAKRQAFEAAPDARSPAYAAELQATLALYSKTRDQIAGVSLFSANEGIEDIATSSLPYMLVDFQAAELIQRTQFVDMPQRGRTLRQARAAYESFLSLLDGYGLITGTYAKMLERYYDDREQFAAVAATDAAGRRDGKIASFKAEKELRNKLETLKRNPRYLENGDEELVREVHLTNISFATHTTFQALDSMNRELPMIAQAPTAPPPSTTPAQGGNERSRQKEDESSWRLDQPFSQRIGGGGPLLSKEGKPLQPFTLVGSRKDLAKGVFRPGHNLPTMSIDEYLEEEKRRGGILEGGTDPQKPQVDEDDMDAVDRETYKAREWDDYKDDNRRGAGNTLNMG
ncbi:hypothetical protein VHEMI03478 [[Torrubiella] hemipterigena]|uniref:TAP42-like protein n=1 Tax=[Torrubiella] hemipterigena TaxID=1531966 RepID=A0A0A1TBB0_9HYPO|nr:hypothetical protein VHEMI03478 [[Torrubiella] hemipterigena]